MSEHLLPRILGIKTDQTKKELRGCMPTKFITERQARLDQASAAKRRHSLAPDVSPGYAARNGTESRRDGRSFRASVNRRLPIQLPNTGQTVGFHPANFSLWNERDTTCI